MISNNGYWEAKINKGLHHIFIDADNFVHFRDTAGCIQLKDLDVEFLKRLNPTDHWIPEDK